MTRKRIVRSAGSTARSARATRRTTTRSTNRPSSSAHTGSPRARGEERSPVLLRRLQDLRPVPPWRGVLLLEGIDRPERNRKSQALCACSFVKIRAFPDRKHGGPGEPAEAGKSSHLITRVFRIGINQFFSDTFYSAHLSRHIFPDPFFWNIPDKNFLKHKISFASLSLPHFDPEKKLIRKNP